MDKIIAATRAIANALDDVDEGVACAGTALESRTFKTNKKAFLFVGAGALRLKVAASLVDARARAKQDPAHFEVGANGWVKISVADGFAPSSALLERWIAESHALYAGAARATPVKGKSAPKKKKKKKKAKARSSARGR